MSYPSFSSSQNAIRLALENDRRDIKDLWNEALKEYRSIVGKDLHLQVGYVFKSADDMIQYGVLQQDAFNKWRHDGRDVDKLRSLLMTNIGLIETGTQKLLAAATPAFPPAAAISTALTFVVDACKGQSTDYDIVMSFFEEMNNFLQRVTILETRVPEYRAYQVCLIDVFTAFLKMCAVATKFITKGRIKTWFATSLIGQDADLSSARNRMTKNLNSLESAAQFAILANTEGIKGGQEELQSMQAKLHENQLRQLRLEREQTQLLESIQQSQVGIQDVLRTELQAIAAMVQQKEDVSTTSADGNAQQSQNPIRTAIAPNTENDARARKLRQTRITGTGEWLFQTPAWRSWSARNNGILLLQGLPGIGKSHLAIIAYDYLLKAAKQDPGQYTLVTCFCADKHVNELNTFDSFLNSVVLQISERNLILRNRFAEKFASREEEGKWYSRYSESVAVSEYLEDLLVPSFGEDSKYQLHVVVDGIDNFESHAAFTDMFETINKLQLRIKIIVTCRSASSATLDSKLRWKSSGSINTWITNISRDDILPDIRLLMDNRLRANDETYGSLAHLNAKTQCAVKDQIEEKAATLLYVDFALRYLGGIGRSGAVIRELENGLPLDTSVLFMNILKSCKRRLPQDLTGPVQRLLVWLTESLDLLDLDQVNQLVQLGSRDKNVRVEEEIDYIFNRILRVGPTTKMLNVSQLQDLDGSLGDMLSTERPYDDGDLLVSLRDQSMREFLRGIDITSWGQQDVEINKEDSDRSLYLKSANHRLIFLDCCQILEVQHCDKRDTVSWKHIQKLRHYAAKYCLRHWQNIDHDRHKRSENIEVCYTFYNLLANRHGLASVLEAHIRYMRLDTIIRKENTMCIEDGYKIFLQKWQSWAESLDEFALDPMNDKYGSIAHKNDETQTYWKGSCSDALQPLFKAHMENWLDNWSDIWSKNWEVARACAFDVLKHTSHKYLSKIQVADEYWKTWITFYEDETDPDDLHDFWQYVGFNIRTTYLMRTLHHRPLTSTGHFATAQVMNFTGQQAAKARHRELLLALEKCTDMAQKAEIHIKLSHEHHFHDFDDDDTTEDAVAPEDDFDTEDDQVPSHERIQRALSHINSALEIISDKTSEARHFALLKRISLLQELNDIPCGGDVDNEIVESFREIRMHSQGPQVKGKSALREELAYYQGNHDRVMNFLIALTPIQRVSLLVYGCGRSGPFSSDDFNNALLPAAVATKRVSELHAIYHEMLEHLKLGNCEIIWYSTLARSHKAVKDLRRTLDILRNASNYVMTKTHLEIGSSHYYADDLIKAYINLASDVFHQAFRSSDQPDVKATLLQDAEMIMFQPLPRSIRLSPSRMIPHLVILAHMQKRMGTFQKFQNTLQRAFDLCWSNLHDTTIANDMENMLYLAKILAMIPSLRREAEIVSSAQLYYLGKFSDLEKFGDRSKAVKARTNEDLEKNIEYSIYILLQREHALESATWFASQSCAGAQLGRECARSHGWQFWDDPMYVCLCCATSVLCHDCYDERIRRNDANVNSEEESEGEIDFCCDAGRYIKTPMDGWDRVRDGRIYIENEDPIEVDTFLEQVRDKWRQSWKDFWKG